MKYWQISMKRLKKNKQKHQIYIFNLLSVLKKKKKKSSSTFYISRMISSSSSTQNATTQLNDAGNVENTFKFVESTLLLGWD